jgi:hypothetical protein
MANLLFGASMLEDGKVEKLRNIVKDVEALLKGIAVV